MSEGEKNTNETFGGLTTLIPQVFYDLIARIIPGSFILIVLYVINKGGIETVFVSMKTFFTSEKEFPSFLFFCLWILLSYCFAMIIWRQIDWYNFLFDKKTYQNKGISSDKEESYKYDYIKTKDGAAGARITKLMAEIHMTEVFSVGLFYCLLYNSFIIICTNISLPSTLQFYVSMEILLIVFFYNIHLLRKLFKLRISCALDNYHLICLATDKKLNADLDVKEKDKTTDNGITTEH